jgi:sigma-B regulation protein RsbU (phosphoserine phosphatase)
VTGPEDNTNSTILTLKQELELLESRARELAACLKAMTLIGSSLDIDEVLERAISSAQEVMRAEASSIMLLDEATGDLYFKQASGAAAGAVREVRIPRGHGIAGWVAETGSPVVVEDAQNDPRFFRGADDQTGFVTRSILAVPLKVKDRIIGVAEAINRSDGFFSEADLPLFTAYASLAAVAIENARMHSSLLEREIWEREIEIARQIQASMQGPERAERPPYRFHALSAAARSVGGDFYDWIELSNGRALVIVGDVSGKGIPAALMMSNALSRLRAMALQMTEPAEILTELNDLLSHRPNRGLFITVFVALLKPDGTFRFSTAGHPPPLLFADGAFRDLPRAGGPPVGIMAGASYRQESITLRDGEIIVLFSDGVTDAVNPKGVDFGLDGLRAVVRTSAERPSMLPSRVRHAILSFEAGHEPSDDVTVAVVCHGGHERELDLRFEHLTPDDLGRIRTTLEGYLAASGFDEKERGRIVLAVDEALTNVIRHAYGGQGGPADLHAHIERGTLQIVLRDKGCGRIPQIPEAAPTELKPGGLGLGILKEVMDAVRFESGADGGCILRMKKNLDDGKSAS